MIRRWALLIALTTYCAASCFAKSLSIQVIQNNTGEDKVLTESSVFEQYVIDYFFEKGNIVSNSPIYINSSADKNSKALKTALTDTKNGGLDYLVRIELTYTNETDKASQNPVLKNIESVKWINYSVLTGREISKGEAKPVLINDESGVSVFAKQIAFDIDKNLIKAER